MRTVHITILTIALLSLGLASGCGDKKKKTAGCDKLAEQISACGRNIGLKGDEEEKAADCKTKLKKGDENVKAAVKCAKHNQCTQFEKCMKKIHDKLDAEREKKRLAQSFDKAKADLQAGKRYSAEYFCKNDEKHTDEMKKWCGNLNRVFTETMTAKLLKARDAMKVTYKETSACDTMLGYAIKVGKKAGDDAGKLCQELKAVKDFIYLKKQVERYMKRPRLYFYYSCALDKLKEMTEVKTPFAQKLRKQAIQLCFYTHGKKVLAEKAPKMKYFCTIKTLYKGFKELKPTDPEIVKNMQLAAEKCEPKPKK